MGDPARAGVTELEGGPYAAAVSYGEPPLLQRPPAVETHHGSGPQPEDIRPIAERLAADHRYLGRGITMAFLDSGFYAHTDLTQPRQRIRQYHDLLAGRSGVDLIARGDVSSWHGMMTSVVAAGSGHLSGGRFRSLAPEADVVLVKVGHMSRVKHDDLAKGIEWVVAHREEFGIRVLNISAGGDYEVSYLSDHLSAAAEAAVRAGIVVVCAVGNAGSNRIVPPASVPAVITVGGVNDDGDPRRGNIRGYSSCFGPTIDGLQKPEVIAPAIWVVAPILPDTPTADEAEVLTLLASTSDQDFRRVLGQHAHRVPGLEAYLKDEPYLVRHMIAGRLRDQKVISGDYKHVDGTSFAAPIVSSVVAQMLEANPALTPMEIKRILIDTARRIPHIAVERQGWGVIHPAAAIAEALRRKAAVGAADQRKAG